MRKPTPTRRPVPPSEQGYIILFAVFLMALLVISLALAAPQVAKSIQRDRDLETWHRGMQYRRAIQLYYRKFHAYPPNANALKETNNIHFLRKQYIDPITNKVDWKPILYGQNKAPTALGFFGQPLAGGATSIVGTGPSGGNSAGSGGSLPDVMGTLFGGSQTNGSSGTNGSPTSTSGTSTTSGAGSPTGSSTGSDQSGQTFGGAGIIGFAPVSPRRSILVYKKKDHYNEWEFTYDPISDTQMITGGNAGATGQPGNSPQPTPSPTQTPNPNANPNSPETQQ